MNTAIKGTPVVVNGVLYTTIPDHVWAIDARTGREIWHYVWPSKGGWHIGNRGVAVLRETVYFETPDCNLVSLNSKDGKEKLAHPDLRSGAVLLRLGRADHRQESRDHRRQRRRSGYSRLHRIARSGNRRAAVALVRASRARNARSEDLAERRSHAARRRHDLGAQHLRSGPEPALLRHRESAAGDRRTRPRGIESVYRVHHRAESRHGEARVVFPAVAARHARLGRGADAGVIRCRRRRDAAQAAGAGQPQRMVLRARPRHGQEHREQRVRQDQLGRWASMPRASRFRIRPSSRSSTARW